MRCGGCSWRSTAVAAAASGGATMAPSAIAARPGHVGDQRAGDDGDRDGREADREHDQAGERRPVVLEISRRGVVGRIEEHGREEERQRELGRHGERRRARKKREEARRRVPGRQDRVLRRGAPLRPERRPRGPGQRSLRVPSCHRDAALERGRRPMAGIRAPRTIIHCPWPTPICPRISPPGQRVVCRLA